MIVDKYPRCLRPFYTLPDTDSRFTNSYDIIFKGQEILSGAQRVHTHEDLCKAALESGISPQNIDYYLDSFRYGSFPHAGGGFGLERVLSRFLDLSNIKSASLFPRSPTRLKP